MFLITIQSKQGQIIDRFCVSNSCSLSEVVGKDDCLTIIEYIRYDTGKKE